VVDLECAARDWRKAIGGRDYSERQRIWRRAKLNKGVAKEAMGKSCEAED